MKRKAKGGSTSILLDTSAYSHFARAGHYGLLERVFQVRLAVLSLVRDEAERGTKRFPELKALAASLAEGKTGMIDDLTEKEYEIIAGLPRKFSDTDRACIAVAQERGMVLATDDEDILAEAGKRGIATFETEDILEEAAKTIGPNRTKDVLADIVKSGADKEFRNLKL
jgi:predicted nucleic acid-binding protein